MWKKVHAFLLLCSCVGLAASEYALNTHTCAFDAKSSVLFCKLKEVGNYSPDRDLSGVEILEIDIAIRDGVRIDITSYIMPDLKEVRLTDCCSNAVINIPADVRKTCQQTITTTMEKEQTTPDFSRPSTTASSTKYLTTDQQTAKDETDVNKGVEGYVITICVMSVVIIILMIPMAYFVIRRRQIREHIRTRTLGEVMELPIFQKFD